MFNGQILIIWHPYYMGKFEFNSNVERRKSRFVGECPNRFALSHCVIHDNPAEDLQVLRRGRGRLLAQWLSPLIELVAIVITQHLALAKWAAMNVRRQGPIRSTIHCTATGRMDVRERYH